MTSSSTPLPDDKIGIKIDYLVRRLAHALKPHGFHRKARQIHALLGSGRDESMAIINLQGNKHNEGSAGGFWISLGVINREISELVSTIPHLHGHTECFEKPHEALCSFRSRIHDVLPSRRERWWPSGMRQGRDHCFSINGSTNLEQLAETLIRLVNDYALPWLQGRASLEFQWSCEGPGWDSNMLINRMAAGTLLGHQTEATDLFRYTMASEGVANMKLFLEYKTWALAQGLSVADVEFRQRETPPSRPGLFGLVVDVLEAKWKARKKGR